MQRPCQPPGQQDKTRSTKGEARSALQGIDRRPNIYFSVAQVQCLGRVTLVCLFLPFVIANADFTAELDLAPIRYGIAVVLGVGSILVRPLSAMRSIAILSPVALVYVFAKLPLYAAMVVVFASIIPMVITGIQSVVVDRRWSFVALLSGMTIVPLAASLDSLLSDGLFSTRYGRPRMLLGFQHPKEAAVAIATPLLIGLLLMKRRRHAFQVALVGTSLMVIVGSRNVALTLLVGSALVLFGRIMLVASGIACAVLLGWIAIDPTWFEKLDVLSSYRLSLWHATLSRVGNVQSVLPGIVNRFGIDNFYVEVMAVTGIFGLMLISLWLVSLLRFAAASREFGQWSVVAIVMIGMFAFFDSGIASVGSMMHIILWSLIVAPYVQRSRRSEL
jgi:hypothetical protein